MARSEKEIIRDLQVRAHQMTDELRDIREGFRRVREAYITVQNYDRMKNSFVHCMREMIDHSNRYQRAYFGTPNEKQQQDKQYEETVSRYEKKIEDYKQELLQEKKAKEEALSRVSSLASQMLTTPGNTELTDVSDRNRPTKLAEDFRNVYDDEWTDGFEFLIEECKWKEEDAIKGLYELLKICHDISSDELQKQFNQIARFVVSPKVLRTDENEPQYSANQQQGMKNQQKNQQQKDLSRSIGAAPSEAFRMSVLGQEMSEDMGDAAHLESSLMDFRKTIAVDVLKSIAPQDLINAVKKKFKDETILKNQHITNFLSKCFKLCWLMGVQYPPMEMDFSHQQGEPLKQDLFKVYRNRGDKIAYVVWPPVFLHHNGPIVCQGYAECNKNK